MPKLFAGTSGFAYPSWKPEFYPAKLPQKSFLNYYASQLNAVEMNYTFRRLPAAATIENWVNQTPAEFVFCIKAHQRITHIARLKPNDFTPVFFNAIDPLRACRRLGAVLFQLPPNLKRDDLLLESFLRALPGGIRYAFEFRNPGWLDPACYALLERYSAALCLAESDRLEIPHVVTAPFVYSRLRKPEYSAAERAEIALRTREMLRAGRDQYVFFKHEESAAGAVYAAELLASG